MKKIDGLRLDYHSGDADIKFSPDFAGQSPEFRLIAVSYWLTSLLDEREKITSELDEARTQILSSAFAGKSVDELLAQGHVILLKGQDERSKEKHFLATFVMGPQKRVVIWESLGRQSYLKLCDIPCMSSSLKGFLRIAQKAFSQWKEIQRSIRAIGAQRLNKDVMRDRTPSATGQTILAAVRNFTAA